MEDPRIGAFGTMALLFLILIKIAVFNEIIERGFNAYYIVCRHTFSSTSWHEYLLFYDQLPLKVLGLAHFFQEKLRSKIVVVVSLLSGLAVLIAVWLLGESALLPILLFALLAIGILLFRHWSLKHFGGVTGDLLGAFIEGMEVILWLAVLLFI